MRAAVVGLAGPTLSLAEAAYLREMPPAGVILFARNIDDPPQLAGLMRTLHEILPCESVLMVDQEGGRVARLKPPHWASHPPCGALGSERAAWLQGALIGAQAAQAGFDMVCAPVLDVRRPGASDVVGDRAFSTDAATVARMGAAMAAGLLAAGIQPAGKHAPGHGRAHADSHVTLPHVDGLDEDDLLPFAANAALPWWLTAHVVYDGVDSRPATLSPPIVAMLRDRLGFAGLLCSDDLAMRALSGSPADRARAAWDAGCDLAMYCPGDLSGTLDVLRAAPVVGERIARLMADARAQAAARRQRLDVAALSAERESLMLAPAA